MSELNRGISVLLARRDNYELAEAYYEGTVPERLPRSMRHLRLNAQAYKVNFCRTIVDSVLDRLELASTVGIGSAEAAGVLNRAWEQNDLLLEANEIHRNALVYGDCYAIVWPDADGEMQISYNSPLTTVLLYDVENPRQKQSAVKVWLADNGLRANVYTADSIRKYSTKSTHLSENLQWTLIDTVDNPFGEVPVFHFRTARPYGRPEHLDAYGLQDAITKTVVTHMYTMDYQGAPQRYALSAAGESAEFEDFEEGDTDRENIGALRNGPGELWYLKGVNEVGQFDPANPDVFLRPIKDYVRAMASLTATPLHYFEATGNVPSGEALRTAEAPLLKKVGDRQVAFGSAWRDLFRFILRANDLDVDVQVEWDAVESLDSLATWDVMLKKINAGLSHKQALREGGYDEELIEQIMAEREAEAANGLYYERKPQVRIEPSEELNQTRED